MRDINVIVYSANIGGYDNFIPITKYDPKHDGIYNKSIF